jgi:hypothetical protein
LSPDWKPMGEAKYNYLLREMLLLPLDEARQGAILDFLRANRLVTLPAYLGSFRIKRLPEAFTPTSPGCPRFESVEPGERGFVIRFPPRRAFRGTASDVA